MKAAHPEAAPATRENPGEILRQARESRDLSQAEVARKLNLTVSSLNNLEAGAFDKLPGHTFARGYIRAYAKLLDMDQATLVQSFDHFTGTHAQGSDVHALGRIEEPVRLSHNIMRIVSLLLLVVVVGGGFVWWKDQSSLPGKDLLANMALEHVEVESADGTTQIHQIDEPEDQAVTAGQQPESEPLALEQAPASSEAPAEQVATAPAPVAPATTPVVTAPAAPAAVAPTAPAAPVAAAPVVAAVPPTPATAAVAQPVAPVAGNGQLHAQFNADCWTSVTDGNGKVLYSGIKRKGESLELSGKPPFAVRLGVARAAQISWNGQPVDIAPFTSGETARLKLGQ